MIKQNHAITISSDLGNQAQAIFNNMGLDIATVVDYILRQIVHNQKPYASPVRFAEANETQKEEILLKLFATVDGSFVDVKKAKGKPAKLGGWEGKVTMADDFNAPLDDFEEYM